MKIQRTTYLSLGSNLNDPLKNLQNAVNLIAQKIGRITKISSVYRTESWGFKGEDFLNICIEVLTNLTPEDLIKKVLQIETLLGRSRELQDKSNSDLKKPQSINYQSRTIDIDILLFDDDIIFYNLDNYNDLKIPHPRMLERKFVLVPLTEIASHVKHPLVKKTILMCLQSCGDNLELTETDLKILRPISLVEKYNYIAIEGNIGAGKTTLSRRIGDDFNAKLVLERFADNPFLPKYYADMERYAFPLEMSFLADRYQQLTDDLAQFDLFKNFIISDYYIFKSLIFAQVSLLKEEYSLYRRMFDIMYKEIAKPDLYIYLYQNTDRLLHNIKTRGRDYEQNIEPEYLDKIHQGYSNFIKTEQNLNTLIIDVSELDFVHNKDDYDMIIKQINDYTIT
jgi:2-amino-4-hydroxy-6-hydroxymethyldihydropteridine diphosphokinase